MKFYFFNSYHQSLMGFQLTLLATGDQSLQLAQANRCDTPELQSALFNSGAVCLLGKSADGADYFLLRKITVNDTEGRTWYINMAVESAPSDHGAFRGLVRSVLLHHEDFLGMLAECFQVRNEELSYEMDTARFWDYVARTARVPAAADSFYTTGNVFGGRLLKALADMKALGAQEVSLLVPESTSEYFVNQNPVFRGTEIGQCISCEAFGYLLARDPAVCTLEEEAPVQKARLQINMTEEQKDTAKRIAKGVLLAVAVYGSYKLVDCLFGKDK